MTVQTIPIGAATNPAGTRLFWGFTPGLAVDDGLSASSGTFLNLFSIRERSGQTVADLAFRRGTSDTDPLTELTPAWENQDHNWELLSPGTDFGVGRSEITTRDDSSNPYRYVGSGSVYRNARAAYDALTAQQKAATVLRLSDEAPTLSAAASPLLFEARLSGTGTPTLSGRIPIRPSARQFRYAIEIPARGDLPAFRYWNGNGTLTLAGQTYEPGQFASYAKQEPVSGLSSGEAAAVAHDALAFEPDGVFAAWLRAGDQVRRPARLYSLVADGQVWAVEHTLVGELGAARSGTDGLVVVAFTQQLQATRQYPALMGSLRDGDTFDRFLPRIAAGVRVG